MRYVLFFLAGVAIAMYVFRHGPELLKAAATGDNVVQAATADNAVQEAAERKPPRPMKKADVTVARREKDPSVGADGAETDPAAKTLQPGATEPTREAAEPMDDRAQTNDILRRVIAGGTE